MMRALTGLIAEDETPQRNELRLMLGKLWPELTIIAECADGMEALEAWGSSSPDIVFLDIRMPGLSGLEVARLARSPAQIIFITAYDEFAVAAFEAGAVDYLLKPVRADRLAATIDRVRARDSVPAVDIDALCEAISGQLGPRRLISWITASVGETVKMYAIEDVILFQSENKYTRVATLSDTAHIRTPLKELMPQLDPEVFWRVHRNAIVRVSAIRQVKRDEDDKLQVWLHGLAEPVAVSDAFRHQFRAM